MSFTEQCQCLRTKPKTSLLNPTPTDRFFRNLHTTFWIAVALICLCVSLLVVFRGFWISHFDQVLSDPVDGRFSIGILEHWDRVFHFRSPMASPLFFYPDQGVLGFSEAFFLLAIPFSILKSVGLDRYMAFQITMMLLTGVGFVSMLYLLRRIICFTRPTAIIGALLFATFNMFYIHIVHPQLVAVVFVPLLWLMTAKYWNTKDSQPSLSKVWISSAALLLALTFLTSFYVAWFTVIFSVVTTVAFLLFATFAHSDNQTVSHFGNTLYQQKWSLLLAATAFGLGLIPFLLVYLPALHETGTRTLADALSYMSPPLAAFNVGRNNVVWGRVASKVEHIIGPAGLREHPAGWPYLTITLFLFSSLDSLIRLLRCRASARPEETRQFCWITALSFACLVLWMTGTRFGDHIPVWEMFFKFVPGASAIRVPPRANLVANVGIVIVCMFGLERLTHSLHYRGFRHYVLLALLVPGLFVEQLNSMPTHLISRRQEQQKFSGIKPPPISCPAFYISNWSMSRSATLAFQTDAILLAEQFGVGTIDGYSGWFPKNWDLLSGSRNHIAEDAREWAQDHHLAGLCALDIVVSKWSVVDLHVPVSMGDPLKGAVQNAGFEEDKLAPWMIFQKVHVTLSSTSPHSGRHCLAEDSGVGSIYQDITDLQPGSTYTVSAWISASPGATASAQIAVFDPGTNNASFSTAWSGSSSWHRISESATVSEASTFRIHLFRNAGSGTVYWDDVSVYREDNR